MGFWNNLWNGVKCATGHHDWNDWTKGECTKSHRCKRCEEHETVPDHSWTEFQYTKDGHCDQARHCQKGHHPEFRVRHIWGPWQLESPRSDSLVRFCRRCPNGRQIKHSYVVLRVPHQELTNTFLVSSQMGNMMPSRQVENGMLKVIASMIIQPYEKAGGGIEIGHRPSGAEGYAYLSWEWRDDQNAYSVVSWYGDQWN